MYIITIDDETVFAEMVSFSCRCIVVLGETTVGGGYGVDIPTFHSGNYYTYNDTLHELKASSSTRSKCGYFKVKFQHFRGNAARYDSSHLQTSPHHPPHCKTLAVSLRRCVTVIIKRGFS